MKKIALVAFFLACLALHARPAWANAPGVAATGAVTTLAATVTGSTGQQTVQVSSSLGCSVGGYVQVMDNAPEISPVYAVPDSLHITAIFQNNHASGASVVCTLSVNPTLDPTGHVAVNPLYGWTTYAVNVQTTTITQVGPNASATQSMYVVGFLAVSATETVTFYLGTGGCSTTSTFFPAYRNAGVSFNFQFVVPPTYYLCVGQSTTAVLGGYVDVLQE